LAYVHPGQLGINRVGKPFDREILDDCAIYDALNAP
jgi:hypothetical protein